MANKISTNLQGTDAVALRGERSSLPCNDTFLTDIGPRPFDRRVGSSVGPAYFPLSSAFSLRFPKSLALSFSYFTTLDLSNRMARAFLSLNIYVMAIILRQ